MSHVSIVIKVKDGRVTVFPNVRLLVIDFGVLLQKVSLEGHWHLNYRRFTISSQAREFLKKAKKWKVQVLIMSMKFSKDQMREVIEKSDFPPSIASIYGNESIKEENWVETIITKRKLQVNEVLTLFSLDAPRIEDIVKSGYSMVIFRETPVDDHAFMEKENVVFCDGWNRIDIVEIIT